MRSIALLMISLSALCFACEPRKSSLLPSRSSKAKPEAESKVELQARAPLPETGPGTETEAPLSDVEVGDLQKVKEEALDRLRHAPIGKSPAQAKQLLRRARALVLADNIPEAQEYYLVACQMGQNEGCHKFGWYEAKAGNWRNAGQFYKTACSGGISKSCNNLGLQLEKQKNWEAALDLYAQACLERHTVSCENYKRLREERLKTR